MRETAAGHRQAATGKEPPRPGAQSCSRAWLQPPNSKWQHHICSSLSRLSEVLKWLDHALLDQRSPPSRPYTQVNDAHPVLTGNR